MRRRSHSAPLAAALFVLGLAALVLLSGAALPGWAIDFPQEWTIDPSATLNVGFDWLAHRASIGPVEFKELTRGLSRVAGVPLGLVQAALVSGGSFTLPIVGLVTFGAVPWWALTAAATLFGHWAAGRRMAMLVLGTCLYFLVVGLWEPAMLTLASVGVSVLLGAVLGTLLGSWAYQAPRVEAALNLLYDVMQTMPVFSYLVPVLLFFGFGPVAALIATVIYAMPPMARVTVVALRRVPPSVGEFAVIVGTRPRQRLWLVMLPAARQGLLVGLNQVIMLSLSVAIIASIIGAGGLGNDVLRGLKSMQLGRALEAGLGITLLAVVLDRVSRAAATRRPIAGRWLAGSRPDAPLVWAAAFILTGFLLAQPLPVLSEFPVSMTLQSGHALNDFVEWLNVTFHGPIETSRDAVIRHLFRPFKEALLALPWSICVMLFALLACAVRGIRFALACVAMLTAIAVSGDWDIAMTSLYLVIVSTVVALAIGLPIGVIAAVRPRFDQAVTVTIDMLQTLPTFVYLIPVVMLFGLGDFPAMVAIVLFALPTAVRYTKDGIKAVPKSMVEAAVLSGCRPRQTLVFVQIPYAMPEIMLGVSQTVMMAFGMLVITALVGTRGLEQQTLIAVSRANVGLGLTAGLWISFLSIIIDRLMTYASARLRARFGQA